MIKQNALPRIALVLGQVEDYALISQFERVANSFEVHVFAAAEKTWLRNLRTSLTVHQFETLADMPGYLRGLEDLLKGFDAIICNEASRLSTFQAIRFAEQANIPTAVLSGEFHPFHYTAWANIRAIQQEVFKKANQHWAFSQASVAMLRAEEVSDDKISLFRSVPDVQKFNFREAYRNKFRNYVGLPSDCFLIGLPGPLEKEYRPFEMLDFLRLLEAKKPDLFERTKILFMGEGSLSRELKYKVHELGLINHVRILSQDTAPFIRDLYCALDIYIQPKWGETEKHEPFPRHIMDAAACGVLPVLPGQVIYRELFSGCASFYDDFNFQQIYSAINTMAGPQGDFMKSRDRTLEFVDSQYCSERQATQLTDQIKALLDSCTQNQLSEHDFQIVREGLQNQYKQGHYSEVVAKATVMISEFQQDPKELAEIYRIRGDAYLACNSLEEATDSYSMVMQLDRGNIGAYKGLAQIAYLGHSHDEAVSFYRKALSHRADDVDSLIGVAMVYRRLGLYDQAVYWLERSIHARREDKKLQAMLFKTCLESPNIPISIIVLERLRDPEEPNANLDLTLGRLYLAMGKNEVGAELVEQALGVSTTS